MEKKELNNFKEIYIERKTSEKSGKEFYTMYYDIRGYKKVVTFDTNVMCAIAGITEDYLVLDMPNVYHVGRIVLGE